MFAIGERNPGCEQPGGGPKLPYSAVGIDLRPGRLRVKEDSRANYADVVEIDHDAQVMVVGDVAMYFDRFRRNVNRALMRQNLRKALEEYCRNGKTPGGTPSPNSGMHDPPDPNDSTGTLPLSGGETISANMLPLERNSSLSTGGGALLADISASETELERPASPYKGSSRERASRRRRERDRDRDRDREYSHGRGLSSPHISSYRVATPSSEPRPMRGALGPGAGPPTAAPPAPPLPTNHPDYDLRSMHDVAMAGLQ